MGLQAVVDSSIGLILCIGIHRALCALSGGTIGMLGAVPLSLMLAPFHYARAR